MHAVVSVNTMVGVVVMGVAIFKVHLLPNKSANVIYLAKNELCHMP